jgi:uncharacterized membrane protein
LRTFTPAAALCLMRRRGALAVALGAAALLEYAGDLHPKAPPRTAAGALAARILSGASCGWIVASSGGGAPAAGAVLGGAGALTGAYGGLAVRMRMVALLGAAPAAILEDVVAIAAALTIVSAL